MGLSEQVIQLALGNILQIKSKHRVEYGHVVILKNIQMDKIILKPHCGYVKLTKFDAKI